MMFSLSVVSVTTAQRQQPLNSTDDVSTPSPRTTSSNTAVHSLSDYAYPGIMGWPVAITLVLQCYRIGLSNA